jgi:hypothetical protein
MFVFRGGSDVFSISRLSTFNPVRATILENVRRRRERKGSQLSCARRKYCMELHSFLQNFSFSLWAEGSGTSARRSVSSALLSHSHSRARTSREQTTSKPWSVPTVLATYTRASHIGLNCRVPLATVTVWVCNTGEKERRVIIAKSQTQKDWKIKSYKSKLNKLMPFISYKHIRDIKAFVPSNKNVWLLYNKTIEIERKKSISLLYCNMGNGRRSYYWVMAQ